MDTTEWAVGQSFNTAFRWEYEDGREKMENLYEKGKRLPWNASEQIELNAD